VNVTDCNVNPVSPHESKVTDVPSSTAKTNITLFIYTIHKVVQLSPYMLPYNGLSHCVVWTLFCPVQIFRQEPKSKKGEAPSSGHYLIAGRGVPFVTGVYNTIQNSFMARYTCLRLGTVSGPIIALIYHVSLVITNHNSFCQITIVNT
jgi:hypothetical protein